MAEFAKIEVSSCVWIPKHLATKSLLRKLTVKGQRLDGSSFSVSSFREDRPGYIGIPRHLGMKLFSFDVDNRSRGSPISVGGPISLRDYQVPIVDQIVERSSVGDFIFKAAPGKGKTVMALEAIRRIGRNAVVIVDQENVMDQWVNRCCEHLCLSPDQIGKVRGPVWDYQDKPITICMVQTLARRKPPDGFSAHFGVVVFDECHTVGAPTFSKALNLFDAAIRFGLSATPDRKDSLNRLLKWSIGEVEVELDDLPSKAGVYILENQKSYSWRANRSKMTGPFINEIAADGKRNLLIANAVKWLYDSGRDVVVISDRVVHLSALLHLCSSIGIPEEDMGIYAKSKAVFVYEKDPRPNGRPDGWVKPCEYSPIRLSIVQKTLKKNERQRVADSSRVVFSTYGVMAKAVDIPRLSAGVDATPRSDATQVYGRILRVLDGKPTPIWVTIEDTESYRSLYQLRGRLADYENSNAEVFLWRPGIGRKRLNVKEYLSDLRERSDRLMLKKAGTI